MPLVKNTVVLVALKSVRHGTYCVTAKIPYVCGLALMLLL